MKTRLFTTALLIAASLSGFAQDKEALKAATQKMIDLTDQENYADLTGTVYPKVYNMVSKDEYLNQLEQKMKGKGYTIHMIRIDPSIDYGSINHSEECVYSFVNYDRMMRIEFDEKIAEKDQKAKEDYFKKLLNTEEVYFISNDNVIDVKERVHLIAIADSSSNRQWTFIDEKSPVAADVLPEPVRNELAGLNPDGTTENDQENQNKVEAQKKAEKEALSKKKKH